jgi:hypothetical protein
MLEVCILRTLSTASPEVRLLSMDIHATFLKWYKQLNALKCYWLFKYKQTSH